MEDEDQWLTRTQAAERLHVNVRTVDRWVRRGVLVRYETPSGRARFKAEDVDALAKPRRADR
jgi:excisionase family DNA binding protein